MDLNTLKGHLIVSCQALPDEPLHSSYIMSRMAKAAESAGAAGIRANSMIDILAIREVVSLPMIGIIKREYPGSPVYITPTSLEIDQLDFCGVEIIAMDATNHPRPEMPLAELIAYARAKYPQILQSFRHGNGDGSFAGATAGVRYHRHDNARLHGRDPGAKHC